MGKKNKNAPDLGKSLIKDRFGGGKMRGKKMVEKNSMLHTTEIQDGYDWGRLNLQSVTEESSFQEFLSTAELAGKEFQGEKMNISFVRCKTSGVLTSEERKKIKAEHEQNKECLKIPRRPKWDAQTTPDELQMMERNEFLEWRRSLAILQEEKGILLTPFEKNLEFWRQLWRVIERSDVIVQIVDARNPLLFRCEDLEKYVKEVSENKMNVILINKSDFLTETQRQIWADYFTEQKIKVAFFSALETQEVIDETEEATEEKSSEDTSSDEEETKNDNKTQDIKEKIEDDINKLDKAVENTANKLHDIQQNITDMLEKNKITDDSNQFNSTKLLTREELITLFKTIHEGPKVTENITTIGLVGYPNVGKSSTINSLLKSKKVSVSATPGKTKHFQTLYLDTDLLLCDCPGLVMPTFVYTKAEMVINGILPIDQMRDHVGPVNLVTNLIPRHIFEEKYGLMLPISEDDEDKNRPPTSEELLNAYGYIRGFMTANGQPDNPRSARYVLKDFVNGKLLYCYAPPTINQNEYHTFPEPSTTKQRPMPPREIRAIKLNKTTGADVDKVFFKMESKGVHAKGIYGKASGVPENNPSGSIQGKPWKQINKHANKKKKEKLRRVYAHLDEH